MNAEIKQKWIEALRSGEYRQGINYLRGNDNTYCCLGVLCDLYAKEHNIEWRDSAIFQAKELNVAGTTPHYLPNRVQEWAEVNGNNPNLLGNRNDEGKTFNEIADIIEKEL